MAIYFAQSVIFRKAHKVIAWDVCPSEHIHFVMRNFKRLCFKRCGLLKTFASIYIGFVTILNMKVDLRTGRMIRHKTRKSNFAEVSEND
jgi:hypothetical protein